MLLLFALIGFAGAGAAFAVARHRLLTEGERDLGLAGIAVMFFTFGALCTFAASGFLGVVAFGGVVLWASYLLMARHLGLLKIEVRRKPATERETRQHHGT
ncbi:MAG: hypothetical protein ACOCVZ_09395 [Gemmatimonadota bacterium]